MALSIVTEPGDEPVDLDTVKAHLRVDVDDENTLIVQLITAARQYAEAFTRRPLMPQTWDLKLDEFPYGCIVLPKPPVTAISSVSYVDQNGDTQTWSSSLYQTDLPAGPAAMPARIEPIFGTAYPTAREVFNAVTVRFVCGYADAETVPAAIKAAMLLLIGDWYANRENFGTGSAAAHALMQPYFVG
jgi:uncharacterized phiE125 gp8 family phage protein